MSHYYTHLAAFWARYEPFRYTLGMGISRGGSIVKYECDYDCELGGCPGHTMQATYHRTSDVLIFEIDGKETYWFGDSEWAAMRKSYDEWKD